MTVHPVLLVAAVSAGLGLVAHGTGLTDATERETFDARFEIRGERSAPRNLVVVGIDDRTLQDLDIRFPFPRRIHARLIDRLRQAGVKVIAFDIEFAEQTTIEDDNALVRAARRAGNVVFAATETNGEGETQILGGPEGQRYARATVGEAGFATDPGRVLRRLDTTRQGIPTFAASAVRRAGGEVPRRGRQAYIDYAGDEAAVRTVSFSAVLDGDVPPGTLRGAIAVVGATAPALQDYHATPTAEVMPGPEVQANAIDTLRRGAPLRDGAGWLGTLAIVALALVAPLTGLAGRPLLVPLAALLVLAAYGVIAQVAFNAGDVLLVAAPLGTLALSTVGTIVVQLVAAALGRARARDALGRYLSDSVAREVLAGADRGQVRLRGQRVEATVLFSDLRGFTTFAERRDPEEVVHILNRYLTAMSDAILDAGGTLVSYMGDGIMAVFGAPIAAADHAERAVATAREMVRRLELFNDWLEGTMGVAQRFKMGVGLNSGPVMSGNVGSERRMEYTTIGDTTNTAARLEGMTKGTPHQVFLGDRTRALLGAEPQDLAFIDELDVRGRDEAVRVFTLTACDAPATQEVGS